MSEIRLYFKAEFYREFPWRARFNVAPQQDAPVIFMKEGKRLLTLMKWGLVPFWAKDPAMGARALNARAETLDEKPTFREAYNKRRCIVPADGFYEWKKVGKAKQPVRIVPKGAPFLPIAGLWESWRTVDEKLNTFTIVTTCANDFLSGLHDRMPVILESEEEIQKWLDPETPMNEVQALLRSMSLGGLDMFEVSTLVNSARNEGPELILPAAQAKLL